MPQQGDTPIPPAGGAGVTPPAADPGQAGAVPAFEFEGKQYQVPEIMKELGDLRTKSVDFEKQVGTLSEDSEALSIIIEAAKENPELKETLRAVLSGEKALPKAPPVAEPIKGGKPAEAPQEQLLRQLLDMQKRGSSETQALRGAIGQMQLEAEKASLMRKYPFLKEKGSYEEMLARGADLAAKRAQELRAMGVPLVQARDLAEKQVAQLTLEQLMRTVMVKEYDQFILKAGKASDEIGAETVTSPAEQVGQAVGPTPSDQAQFIKALEAAAGDPLKRRQIYLDFATKMNVNPMELFGLDPSLRRPG